MTNTTTPTSITPLPPKKNLNTNTFKGVLLKLAVIITYFIVVPSIMYWHWQQLDLSTPENQFWFMIQMLAGPFHLAIFWGLNLIMYFIYAAKHPFFEQYRVHDTPWPWEEDYAKWKVTLKKSVCTVFLTQVLVLPILVYLDWLSGTKFRFDLESFPTIGELIPQMIFFLFVEDTMYYWMHRLLHWGKMYRFVHKIHHEYHITVSIAGAYVHPMEYLLADLIPTSMGAKLLGSRCHFATFLIWAGLRIVGASDAHSGYEFPWSPYSLPFFRSSTFHNYHHTHSDANYGALFPIWDYLCGTNVEVDEVVKRQEGQKRMLEKAKDTQKKAN